MPSSEGNSPPSSPHNRVNDHPTGQAGLQTVSSSSLPSVGKRYESRERLHDIIRQDARARGYIIKQSITSALKVNWYCANKYHSPKCPAGIKAVCENGIWVVTDAVMHTDACTKNREKVLGRRLVPDTSQPSHRQSLVDRPPSSTSSDHSNGATGTKRRSSAATLSAKDHSSSRNMPRKVSNASSTSSSIPTPPETIRDDFNEEVDDGNGRKSKKRNLTSSTGHALTRRRRSTANGTLAETHTVTILDPSYHFPGVDFGEESLFGNFAVPYSGQLLFDPSREFQHPYLFKTEPVPRPRPTQTAEMITERA